MFTAIAYIERAPDDEALAIIGEHRTPYDAMSACLAYQTTHPEAVGYGVWSLPLASVMLQHASRSGLALDEVGERMTTDTTKTPAATNDLNALAADRGVTPRRWPTWWWTSCSRRSWPLRTRRATADDGTRRRPRPGGSRGRARDETGEHWGKLQYHPA